MFLPNLLSNKAARPSPLDRAVDKIGIGGREGVSKRGTSSAYVTWAYAPYTSNWDLQRVVENGYDKVIWVHRVIDARSTNCSRLPLVVRKGTGPEAEEVDHPLLPLLNKRANLYETGRMFRYRLHSLLQLSKRGVFVEVIQSRAGDILLLQHLNPIHVWPIPSATNFVDRFEVRLADGSVYELPPVGKGVTDGVMWIRRPHPIDPYSSQTWVEAAGLSIELDYYQRLFNRNFMQNDGRPGGIIAVQGSVDEATADSIQARAAGGIGNAGKVSVIEADAMQFLDLSTTPRDAQYNEGRGVTKQEILVAGGTPLSVLGDASGRTFSNADAEEEVWWRATLLPDLELEASYWDLLTGDGWDDEIFVAHDLSSVNVLQRDERERRSQAGVEFDKGLITVDEYRKEAGYPEFEVPGSRVTWVPGSGKVPVGTEEDTKAVIAAMSGQPETPMPLEEGEPIPGEETTPEEDWQTSWSRWEAGEQQAAAPLMAEQYAASQPSPNGQSAAMAE